MKKLRLLVDSDSVVVDLVGPWCAKYNELYHDDLTVEKFGGDFGGIHKVVKPECGKKVYDIFKEEGFFESLDPLEGAIEGLEELNSSHDLYIVTAYSGTPNSAKGKVTWYQENCPFLDLDKSIILCRDKFLLRGDVMVDDSLKNLKLFYTEQRQHRDVTNPFYTICYSAPHNKEAGFENYVDYVVGNWTDLLHAISDIAH
jgi:5'(3')-deoxyribonucleotidase